jgi:hypothetical protein
MERQTYRARRIDGKTDRQTNKETERKTYKETERYSEKNRLRKML